VTGGGISYTTTHKSCFFQKAAKDFAIFLLDGEKEKTETKHNYNRKTPTPLSPTPLATRPREPNSEHRLVNATLRIPFAG